MLCKECLGKEAKSLSIKEMDIKQKEMALLVKEELEKKYNTKVEVFYTNLGFDVNSRDIGFNMFIDDYSYKQFVYKFTTECKYYSVGNYLYNIEMDSIEANYKLHKATPEEIYIANLIKDFEGFYIIDGELHSENSDDTVGLDYIDKLTYNKENGFIVVVDEQQEITVVDLCKGIINWVDDEMLALTNTQETKIKKITLEDKEKLSEVLSKKCLDEISNEDDEEYFNEFSKEDVISGKFSMFVNTFLNLNGEVSIKYGKLYYKDNFGEHEAFDLDMVKFARVYKDNALIYLDTEDICNTCYIDKRDGVTF